MVAKALPDQPCHRVRFGGEAGRRHENKLPNTNLKVSFNF